MYAPMYTAIISTSTLTITITVIYMVTVPGGVRKKILQRSQDHLLCLGHNGGSSPFWFFFSMAGAMHQGRY